MNREDIIRHAALLEDLTGHFFSRRQLLYDAIVSPGYQNENGGYCREYQKGALANIGDAVLDVLATEHLMEGRAPFVDSRIINAEMLTEGRIDLINGKRLTALSHSLGLERVLLLNAGELNEISGEKERCRILGESFEAIIGALFLDGGLEPCRTFLRRVEFYPPLEEKEEVV